MMLPYLLGDTAMTRRLIRLLVTLVLALLVAPLAAQAQPARKVPRIGFIGDTPGPYADAFRQGLRERGYLEGETIAMEYRWAEGRNERLPDLVAARDLHVLGMGGCRRPYSLWGEPAGGLPPESFILRREEALRAGASALLWRLPLCVAISDNPMSYRIGRSKIY
jgi:hypothetical protein